MEQKTKTIITDVLIYFIVPDHGHIGFATVLLNDCIQLNSIAIHEKRHGGYRITYPCKGEYYFFHPITIGMSKEIERVILEELKNVDNKDVKLNDRYNSIDTTTK